VGEVLAILYPRLGLEYVGVGEDLLAEVLTPIIGEIVDSRSTKPKPDQVASRLEKSRTHLYKAVAVLLIERLDDYTQEQLEFIVSHAGDAAGRAAPKLYKAASRLGLSYIIDALRHLWRVYGRPLPVKCPRCMFDSLTPELECIVCGARVGEDEVKDAIGFRRLLREFAETVDKGIIREVLAAGYVYYDGEIHPPSIRPASGYTLQLYLTKSERRELEEDL